MLASVMADQLQRKDEWRDLLAERKNSSDVLWLSLYNWVCDEYKFSRKRSPDEIRDDVFKDPTIRNLITEDPRVKSRIDKILEEMAHSWSLRSIRFLGYFVTKIMKSIYSSFIVRDSLDMSSLPHLSTDCSPKSLSQAIGMISKDTPILYLPSHRSYADFILLSYICFSMNLPLPSIAAGTDFLSLNQIASLLRSSGAFFIRRSFRDDSLYWQTFRAYVESQVTGGERPLEFFVEGTRSRSGKSLYPKTGLLKVVVDSFLQGRVPDVTLIPISISYDRLLEEDLYAKELLPREVDPAAVGVKPRETPIHLMSGAQSILNDNFGSVYVKFCQPISLREASYSFRNQDLRLSGDPLFVEAFIKSLAKKVIARQVRDSMISLFDLFAFTYLPLITVSAGSKTPLQLNLDAACHQICTLAKLFPKESLSFNGLSEDVVKKELRNSFQVHHNVILGSTDKTVSMKMDPVSLFKLRLSANKAMQVIFIECISSVGYQSLDILRSLRAILSREFVAVQDDEEESQASFMDAQAKVSSLPTEARNILSWHVHYFVDAYLRIIVSLESLVQEKSSLEEKNLQDLSLNQPLIGIKKEVQKVTLLSSDLIDNCLAFLRLRNILVIDKAKSGNFCIRSSSLKEIVTEITSLDQNKLPQPFLFKSNL